MTRDSWRYQRDDFFRRQCEKIQHTTYDAHYADAFNTFFNIWKKNTMTTALKFDDLRVGMKIEVHCYPPGKGLSWVPATVDSITRCVDGYHRVQFKCEGVHHVYVVLGVSCMTSVRLPQPKYPIGTAVECCNPFTRQWLDAVVQGIDGRGFYTVDQAGRGISFRVPESDLRPARTVEQKQADAVKDAVDKATKPLNERIAAMAVAINNLKTTNNALSKKLDHAKDILTASVNVP